MQLLLKRIKFSEKSTIGELYVDGKFECYTLEDVVREVKIPNETAIPYGTYTVTISYSPRFKRYLPELHDVPNFSKIRIHPGNTDKNTEGCILVGENYTDDFISNSRVAFNKLYPKIVFDSQQGNKISIEITK